MGKFITVLLILIVPYRAFSQSIEISGRVETTSGVLLKDALVINLTSQKEAKIEPGGKFLIRAELNDILAFSGKQFSTERIIVTESVLKSSDFKIIVDAVYQLDEVVINKYNNLDSESLGLVPKGQKRYTPAERRLKTASEFKPIFLLGTLAGGALPIDPILNAISGRTKMLKRELEVEKKYQLIEQLNFAYTYQQLSEEFKIPEEHVPGFIYYVIEDKQASNFIKSKNNEMLRFLVSGLAVKYLEIINDEK